MLSLSWSRNLGSLTLVLAGGLCLPGAGNPSKGDIRKGISHENFARIKHDMPEKAVLDLLGKPDKSAERTLPDRGQVKISLWKHRDEVIAVTFRDGKVLAKVATFAPATGSVADLIKEHRAILEELKKAKADPESIRALKLRMESLRKKVERLTDVQEKEFLELLRKDDLKDLKKP
jgi:hypothetical protein